jgi:hypothetical protein
MPRVQIRIHQMNNGKIEMSCEAVKQPHSRPYDTPAHAKATLLRLGVPGDSADAFLAALRPSEWIDVGEYEIEENILKETGFTAV